MNWYGMTSFFTGNSLKQELENPELGQDAIVEGLIFRDTINMFYSEPGAGKSVISVNMMAAMSGGWNVFGLLKMKRFARCSYLQLEGSTTEQLGRLNAISKKIPIDFDNIAWHTTPLFVESEESIFKVTKELLDYKPEVIFIDSFYCLTTKGLSSELGFLAVRNMIKTIKDKTKATIIILHHSAKPVYQEGKKVEIEDPFLGSQYMKAFLDMSFLIKRIDSNRVEMIVKKESRNAEGIKRVVLQFDKKNWIVTADQKHTEKPAYLEICDYLQGIFAKGLTTTASKIAEDLNKTERHIRRLKNDGHFNHLVRFDEKEGRGNETVWAKK